MNTRLLNTFLIFGLFILLSALSGCAVEALGGLEAGEFAALSTDIGATEGLEGVFALDASTGTISVLDEDAFLSALEKVKMEEPSYYGETPKLYTERNGMRDYFGEAPDNQTVRITKGNANASIDLAKYDMKMYRVNGETVNIHTTAEINNYNLYKLQLHKDDIVLVIRKVSEALYEIRLGKNVTGFVYAGLLTALSSHHSTNNSIIAHGTKYVTCQYCHGYGYFQTYSRCTYCGGAGYLRCTTCGGGGYLRCTTCGGGGYLRCTNCGGGGYLRCSTCGGGGYLRDRRGNTYKCATCNGQGQLICRVCGGQGRFQCYSCHGQGQFQCSTCKGQGKLVCNMCLGQGQILIKQTCSNCNGAGQVLVRY
jgi:hypothetical protein